MAALMAWKKERSKIPAINAVTREVSLDLADGLYTVDALEHIPGKLNEWADVLSRQFMPNNTLRIPQELAATPRYYPAARDHTWWRLEARPSDCVAVVVEVPECSSSAASPCSSAEPGQADQALGKG